MRINFHITIVCCGLAMAAGAQERLTIDQYMQWVAAYHPIAVQANLSADIGALAPQASRGAFDPKLMVEYAQKNFEQKEYYQQFEAGIKAPTRLLGMAVETGYMNNDGVQLNPEQYTPENGLAYAGIVYPSARDW